MKHIVWAFIAAALIFTGTESFARGFSVGVFGAYSIDGGPIEETINEKRFLGDRGTNYYAKIDYDMLVIPGAGLFASYTFGNGFSVRTGGEFYKLASGNDISKDMNNLGFANNEYEIQYEAFALPILFGFTLSPDKGRTCIYTYAGVALSIVKIEQIYKHYDNGAMYWHTYESDNDTFIPGFAALIGIERRLFFNISVIIEYTFYKCEDYREESGEYYSTVNGFWDYNYTERYGLPRQQARLGLKYSF